MNVLYEYTADKDKNQRPIGYICQGSREFIEKFIKQSELYDLCGGVIVSGNIKTGEEYIGAMGKRSCRRFRRILRERGAEFQLLKNTVPPIKRD